MMADNSDSDDEEMKKAFWQEMDERYGGPISFEQIQQWSAELEEAPSGQPSLPAPELDSSPELQPSGTPPPRSRAARADQLPPRGTAIANDNAGVGDSARPCGGSSCATDVPLSDGSSSPAPSTSFDAMPASGWLTPATPHRSGVGGKSRRHQPLEQSCSETLDVVVTESGVHIIQRLA